MIRSAGMLVVGLTGGIGAGKSTVSALLAAKGGLIVDTDVLSREVSAPGGGAHELLVARFGPDLAVDRAALADVVFADPEALADLNAIVHPAVREAVHRRLGAIEDSAPDALVVIDIPLLVETGRDRYDVSAVVVVDCPEDLAVARLVEYRGMQEADARRRIAAQASRAERVALADIVIPNTGSLADLALEVDRAWVSLRRLRG